MPANDPDYMREYMRKRRAEKKREKIDNLVEKYSGMQFCYGSSYVVGKAVTADFDNKNFTLKVKVEKDDC